MPEFKLWRVVLEFNKSSPTEYIIRATTASQAVQKAHAVFGGYTQDDYTTRIDCQIMNEDVIDILR